MSDNTNIEWTDCTWSITAGCTEAGPECTNCYAKIDSWRLAHNPNPKVSEPYQNVTAKTSNNRVRWSGTIKCLPERLDWPLKWKKPRRIFVANMSDLFHSDVPFSFIDQAFAVMALCPHHQFQLLTKRSQLLLQYITERPYNLIYDQIVRWGKLLQLNPANYPLVDCTPSYMHWPLPNVWLGISVGTQQAAEKRMPHIAELSKFSKIITFVSAEPLLAYVNFQFERYPVKWLILGGESGIHARLCNPNWIRSGLQQAEAFGVAKFVKQLGTVWAKESGTYRLNSKGGNPEVWPFDLRIREFPLLCTGDRSPGVRE